MVKKKISSIIIIIINYVVVEKNTKDGPYFGNCLGALRLFLSSALPPGKHRFTRILHQKNKPFYSSTVPDTETKKYRYRNRNRLETIQNGTETITGTLILIINTITYTGS